MSEKPSWMRDKPWLRNAKEVDERGLPVDMEHRRFFRLIEERVLNKETGIEDVTLACGHQAGFVNIPQTREYTYCVQCEQVWKNGLTRIM